jgi:CubicO group peptidase (beta-lactamase class C family)
LAGDEVAGRIAAFENGLHPATIILGAPEVKWTVQERMAFWHVPGLSVAVIRNGQIAWAKGYGVKQVGANEPVDTESVFSAGSVSKMAAAIVSLRLVMEGKLALVRM